MKTKNPWPFPTELKPVQIMADYGLELTTKQMNPYKKVAEARAFFEATARKLTDENRAFLLKKAEILGVGIVHVFDEDNPKGGMSIAFRKVSPFPAGRMVEVAVATCSHEDSFSRKVGTKLALEAFFDGKTIQLPLSDKDSVNGLATQVKWAFEGMWYAI